MPKSQQGKDRSRLNSLKHGLSATDDLFLSSLKIGDRQTFKAICNQINEEHNPATPDEIELAHRIAIQKFRLHRLYCLENSAADKSKNSLLKQESILPHLDRLARYEWRINKQLNELISSLNHSQYIRSLREARQAQTKEQNIERANDLKAMLARQ